MIKKIELVALFVLIFITNVRAESKYSKRKDIQYLWKWNV